MRIENLRHSNNVNRPRVSATITWEEAARPAQEFYFETDPAFAASLTCDPHAFLLAGAISALHYGERRVFIDAEICPDLADGLTTAMKWLCLWQYPNKKPLPIEASRKSGFPVPEKERREGFFFSGGIDSFATFYRNRAMFPLDHPRSIKDGILAFGLEQDSPEHFEHVKKSLSVAASELGFNLIPLYTNIYLPFREEDAQQGFSFWIYSYIGAALAAIGHSLSNRLSGVSIAASDTVGGPIGGSNTLLDEKYSSFDLRIRHDGIALSRLDKTNLLVESHLPWKYLRVCNRFAQYSENSVNCGKCEKCIRTMLALMALGHLDKIDTFPVNDVTPGILMKTVISHELYKEFYVELFDPLKKMGRNDLCDVLKLKQNNYEKMKLKGSIKSKVQSLDKQFFNGNLQKLLSR